MGHYIEGYCPTHGEIDMDDSLAYCDECYETIGKAELAALRARAAELEKERDMAKRLMRAREARINAIRQTLDQNKGSILVRAEARYLCDCPYSEIDLDAARSSTDAAQREGE